MTFLKLEPFAMTTMKAAFIGALALLGGTAPLAGQSSSPITFHGYLTQGMAASDSHQMLGIPTTGTTDYRSVALQARYTINPESGVVVQVSHRRIGASPLAVFEPAVELDWAFLHHRLGPVTVRAGRLPIQRGFYNEIRDVGTLLPFFRAPYVAYPDGTEAVDGLSVGTFLSLGEWGVDANAFAGGTEWKGLVPDVQGTIVPMATRSERTVGSQIWVITPIRGVRVGGSFLTYYDDAFGPAEWSHIWSGSAELDRDRFMVRSEITTMEIAGLDFLNGYAHARVKLTPRFHVMGQYERSDMSMEVPVVLSWTEMEDAALGVAFAVSPHLVLKLEGHRAEGFSFDTGTRLAESATSNYGIASISVSF